MGNLGGGEIVVILLVALLVLGPQKLPEAAKQLGKAVREFRSITSGFQRELRDAINTDDVTPATVPSGLPESIDSTPIEATPADGAAADGAAADGSERATGTDQAAAAETAEEPNTTQAS